MSESRNARKACGELPDVPCGDSQGEDMEEEVQTTDEEAPCMHV